MRNLKAFLKLVVFNSGVLRKFFILLYQWRGRKPWSAGYSLYKLKFIRDVIEHRLDMFKKEKLPDFYGAHLDERTVEYPWFFSRLKDDEITILDAGSALNHVDILRLKCLQNRKLYLSTLSFEGFETAKLIPSYVYEDIRRVCFKDNFFDAVVSISTLEHVGMDNTFLYTPDQSKRENDRYAFIKAVIEIKRVLKSGGSFYVTLPYGRFQNLGWFQIFDAEMLQKFIDAFAPAEFYRTYFQYEGNQWNFSTAAACRDGLYFDVHQKTVNKDHLAAAQCVVCLQMTKA